MKGKEGLDPMKDGLTAIREKTAPGNWRLLVQGEYNTVSSSQVQNTIDVRFSKDVGTFRCTIIALDQVCSGFIFFLEPNLYV